MQFMPPLSLTPLLPHLLPWILASLSFALLATAGVILLIRRRRRAAQALPTEWALTARPVFSSTERRLHRLLCEALPQQIVLAKLPLIRFCQPTDPMTVRYWYALLANSHVNFAICSSSGRVLAVIDIEGDRAQSRRAIQIKSSVLAACRVRYLRSSADRLPSIPELQMLVPQSGSAMRPSSSSVTSGSRARERATLWQDSGFMQDSFFGMDGRSDVNTTSGFGASRPGPISRDFPPSPEDVGGVVIDTPVSPLRH
jgi:hypothetical protein